MRQVPTVKIAKSGAALHPVPNVWHQVSVVYIIVRYHTLLHYYITYVGIDLIGPLATTKKGNKYVVTLVDYFSK